jgi:hypothetical protein
MGSASNAPNDNTISAGVGYSFSGRSKARLIREIADAECEYTAAVSILQDYQRWVIPTIEKSAARAEVQKLAEAKDLLERTKALATKQLASNVITITEYNNIRQSYVEVVNRILDLKSILSTPTDPIAISKLLSIVDKVKSSEARVISLKAELEDQSSWDVSVSTGLAKEFNGSSADPSKVLPNIGVTFRWSFGGGDTRVARVSETAKLAVSSDKHSIANSQVVLFNLIETDIGNIQEKLNGLKQLVEENESVLQSLKGLETSQAIKTRIDLEIQTVLYKAEVAGLTVKLAEIDKYVRSAK